MYLDELFFTVMYEDGMLDIDYAVVPLILDVILVYINLYVLYPRYFKSKKYISYFIFSIVLVIADVGITLLYIYFGESVDPYFEDLIASLIGTITLLATAVAIKIGKDSYEQRKVTEQLKLDQTKMELNYLKQQINPHFLFNILNTINIQSISHPESVSDTVLQLSDMLRYQIYEAGKSDTVTLKKEIEFLNNYASLEKVRRNNLKLEWNVHSAIPNVRITPFLFLPLVENAFKHSVSISEEEVLIKIDWIFQSGNLVLSVQNTIGTYKNNEGGFGIDNLRKRLELLYPKKHNLEFSISNNTHKAILEMTINESNNY